MPVAAIEAYLDRLAANLAELKILMADANTLPYLSESARNERLRGWMKVVNQYYPAPARPATPARLKLMGIGIRHVK
jgi:hypothetical protein